MAFSKPFTASLLLLFLSFLLLQLTANANQMMGINAAAESPVPQAPPIIDCGVACDGRCQKSKRPNLCKRACGSCCSKCNCVPPGTSGNYDACSCYSNRTTKDGFRKCP
ncbi:hypothetical protein U1Q18_040099 [Sarracenia purpurea var. burkii]